MTAFPSITKHSLPQDSLFTRLLSLAYQCSTTASPRPAIIDLNTNTTATIAQILSDVLHLRSAIISQLSEKTLQILDIPKGTTPRNHHSDNGTDGDSNNEVYIHLLAPGGYEFTIGILAILALGAVCSPLSTAQPVNELAYYARKTKAVAVLTASVARNTGDCLATVINSASPLASSSPMVQSNKFIHIPILGSICPERPFIPPQSIIIANQRFSSHHSNNNTEYSRTDNYYIDPNTPSLVIFTSGTTGPPKAAVLHRASITDGALRFAEQFNLTPQSHLLHLLPVHHATGVWVSFFPFLQAGATIEFKSGGFDPRWTWGRWKDGAGSDGSGNENNERGVLTHFTGVPTIYMRLMRYYNQHIATLPSDKRRPYDNAVQNFEVMMCGTSALPKPIDDFWTRLLGHNRRIIQRYGSTELGVVFNMSLAESHLVPDGSVGEVSVGVDVKLLPSSSSSSSPSVLPCVEEEDTIEAEEEGEILVKSPTLLIKYLHDPLATSHSFDTDGYFHTGDIARRIGKYYFIIGRASVDIIKSGGYKISALDVEREALALPYVVECMVVGVPDPITETGGGDFGERVGCVVVVLAPGAATVPVAKGKGGKEGKKLTLTQLRNDLRTRLAGYKLPTLLRVIDYNGEGGERGSETVGEIPKSATGKIVKTVLGPIYFPPGKWMDDPGVQVWMPHGSGERHNHRGFSVVETGTGAGAAAVVEGKRKAKL